VSNLIQDYLKTSFLFHVHKRDTRQKRCTSYVWEQRKWATRATTFIAVKRHQESHVGYGLTFVSLFHEDRKPASSRHEKGERPRVPLKRALLMILEMYS